MSVMGRFARVASLAFAVGVVEAAKRSLACRVNVVLATERVLLQNGLLGVFHRDSSARQVYVHVRYYVGGQDDPAADPASRTSSST